MINYLIIIPIGVLGLTGLVYTISKFNLFQRLKQDIEKSFSDLKTELTRRTDLISDLKLVINSYTGFEKETYKEVTKSREPDRMNNILKEVIEDRESNELKDLVDKQKLEHLDSLNKKSIGQTFKESFGNFKAVSEDYPKLKAFKEYLKLIEQIEITEDRINDSRRNYNKNVIVFNKLVKTLPTNLIAWIFNFKMYDYYKEVNV